MLRLEPFELKTPTTVAEALAILRSTDDCMVVAGGTDLVPKMKRGQFTPGTLLSLSGIEELRGVKITDDEVRIGALTTLSQLVHLGPASGMHAVFEAASRVATPIIRNSATVGGNLLQDTRCRYYDRGEFWRESVGRCLKKDGDVCCVAPGGNRCFATLCSDLAPAFIVLDAHVTIAGHQTRSIPLEKIYTDDGMAHVDLKDEFVTEVVVPRKGYASAYKKMRIRDGFDFPEVGVAVAAIVSTQTTKINIAVTGVGPKVFAYKQEVSHGRFSADAVVADVRARIKPMDTLFFAPSYRKTVVCRFLKRTLDELVPPR